MTAGMIPQILSMADTLPLEVIVEGIETKLQTRCFTAYNQLVLSKDARKRARAAAGRGI